MSVAGAYLPVKVEPESQCGQDLKLMLTSLTSSPTKWAIKSKFISLACFYLKYMASFLCLPISLSGLVVSIVNYELSGLSLSPDVQFLYFVYFDMW